MNNQPVPLKRGIEAFFRHLGSPPSRVQGNLRTLWSEAVGPALASATQVVELTDGVLVVACDDPAWASQISWMETQIKSQLADLIPDAEVNHIRTRIIS